MRARFFEEKLFAEESSLHIIELMNHGHESILGTLSIYFLYSHISMLKYFIDMTVLLTQQNLCLVLAVSGSSSAAGMPPPPTPIDDLSPSLDVEDFFVHIYEATNEEGWINVQEKFDQNSEEHDGRICYRFSGCGSCMTRLKFVVPTTLPANSLMIRPEVSSRSMSEITGLLHTQYKYQINPGDAVVEVADDEKEASLRGYAMRQVLESPSVSHGAAGYAADEEEAERDWNSYMARMIVRQDVPEPGMAAMVVLPIGRRHTVVFQVGAVKAYTLTVQPHEEPGKVIVAHVMFLPFSTYPIWATGHFSRLCNLEKNNFTKYLKATDLQRLCQIDSTYYTVLHLRGCNRGVPLLPYSGEGPPDPTDENVVVIGGEDGAESYWVRWADSAFTFEAYLRQLLLRCDIELQVFTELSGRKLVPYQVAVVTSEWESCKDGVIAAFHKQQRAYRRMNGGVSAPRVGEAQQARFQHADPRPKSKCFVQSSCDMVVRKTFIDMSDSDYTEGNRHGWLGSNNQVGGSLIRSSTADF